jgi:hypothetical protein
MQGKEFRIFFLLGLDTVFFLLEIIVGKWRVVQTVRFKGFSGWLVIRRISVYAFLVGDVTFGVLLTGDRGFRQSF